MKCSMKAYAISFGGLILASLDGVSLRFRQSEGRREGKTGVETCQRSQLSSPGASLTLLQGWQPGSVEKFLWLGRALCQPD